MATLDNKTVLIFGGSSGIGYGVAQVSLISRASLVIMVSSNLERVNPAVNQLQAGNFGPGVVRGEVVDASDRAALKDLVIRIGEVDHIVWTSGDPLKLAFPDVNVEELQDMFDVRFWGPVIVAQNAKFRVGGSLTLTEGVALLKPMKTWSIGAGIAGAVDSLTRGLAVDLAPIRVNSVSPGIVKTELWNRIPDAQRENYFTESADRLLVKHVGDPLEVAEAYLFLMKCTFITGQRIEVDGGYVLGA